MLKDQQGGTSEGIGSLIVGIQKVSRREGDETKIAGGREQGKVKRQLFCL